MNRRHLLSLLTLLAAAPGLAATPEVVAVDIVLEPDAELAERARTLNARLRSGDRRGFALDASHVPHVSVLQQYVRRDDLPRLGPLVRMVLDDTPAPERLEVVGIDTSPWNGLAMVSLRVAAVPALLRLQEALVAAFIPLAAPMGDAGAFVRDPPETDIDAATLAYVSGFVLKQTGQRYQPHVTVGMTSPAAAAKLAAEPFERQAFGVSAVAIHQLGNYGTARRRLWP